MNSNNFNPYNPYGYGYTPYNNTQRFLCDFVDGIEGAKKYPMMPGQTMLLMDKENPICFRKVTDNTGKASLSYYKLVDVSEEEISGIIPDKTTNELKSEISSLNKKIDELYSILNKEGK